MRCICCDRNLSDYESTIRHSETKEFQDTCLKCLDGLNIPWTGRKDLDPTSEPEIDDDYLEEDPDDGSIPF